MGGLLAALNSGKTSLHANQTGLEVSGNNIANVNTPGYSREKVVYSNVPTFSQKNFFVGHGVRVSNVQRDHSIFLENQLVGKRADFGLEDAQKNSISELERLFPIEDDNISADISNFFESIQDLSTSPGDRVMRNSVLHQGGRLCSVFRQTANELDRIQEHISKELVAKVDIINNNLKELADLNGRILTIEASGQDANAQRDRQEFLLQEVAQETGAKIVSSKNGMLSLHIPGGLPLVQGTSHASISYKAVGADLSFELHVGSDTKPLTRNQLGGAMHGMLRVREEIVPKIKEDLDILAYDIATIVNTKHKTGYDPQGNLGINFFADPPNLGQIAEPGKPEHFDAARNMSVILTDGMQIAAAGNPEAAPGDNENALALADLKDIKINGEETFAIKYAKIASFTGTEANRHKLAFSGAKTTMEQVQNLRDSVSAVSLDEEMVSLIQFQKGFQTSAKFLSTVDEMLQTLINMR